MARKFWVVMPDEGIPLNEMHERGRYIPYENLQQNFGIFFNKQSAEAFAETVSTRMPGIEIQIAEATNGFYAPPPQKIIQKQWTADGEYIVK